MTITEQCKSIVDSLLNLNDCYEVGKFLETNGIHKIGSGCESIVYSNDDLDYVIKYQHSPFTFSGAKKEVPSTIDFAPQVVFKGKGYTNIIIQVKCIVGHMVYTHLGLMDFINRVEREYSIGDTHEGNIGILDGRLVVIDW